MTNDEFSNYMSDVFERLRNIREKAHKEYAQRHDRDSDNVFANFERHAFNLGMSREKVWAVYASKHWDGIISHIAGNVAQREPIVGRVDDLLVYLLLFRGMVKDGLPKLSN